MDLHRVVLRRIDGAGNIDPEWREDKGEFPLVAAHMYTSLHPNRDLPGTFYEILFSRTVEDRPRKVRR